MELGKKMEVIAKQAVFREILLKSAPIKEARLYRLKNEKDQSLTLFLRVPEKFVDVFNERKETALGLSYMKLEIYPLETPVKSEWREIAHWDESSFEDGTNFKKAAWFNGPIGRSIATLLGTLIAILTLYVFNLMDK